MLENCYRGFHIGGSNSSCVEFWIQELSSGQVCFIHHLVFTEIVNYLLSDDVLFTL